MPALDVFTVAGFCAVYERPSDFRVGPMYASLRLPDSWLIPNWREHLDGVGYRLVTRLRDAYHILRQELGPAPDSRTYVAEQR